MKTFTLTLKLAVRQLLRQRRRTASTIAAIVVGLIGLTLLDGYVSFSMAGLRETIIHSGTGHIQLAASDRYFDEGDTNPVPFLLDNAVRIAKTLRRDPAVKAVLPSLSFEAVGQAGTRMRTLRLQAYPTALRRDNLSFLTLREGKELDPQIPGQVLVGQGVANALGLTPGSSISISAVAADGSLANREFRVAGVVSTGIADVDRAMVVADLADAQALIGTDKVPLLTVFLEQGDDTDAVAARWQIHPPGGTPLSVKTWHELSPYYQQASGSYFMVLGVAGLIVLIVALFSIAGTLNLSVLERGRELGTIRALGTRRGLVVRQIVTEGVLLGLAGAVFGAILGALLTHLINSAGGLPLGVQPGMNQPLTVLFQSEPLDTVKNGLWVIAASLVGAWVPGWFASRRLPAVLLRTE